MKETPSQPRSPAPARKSGRLGTAETRLDAALDRLDAALAERTGDPRSMKRLQEENAALRQVRDGVSERLDAAVERLRRALAH